MTDLEQRYSQYIAVLNARRFDDLQGFVADELVYNGEAIGAERYRAMLEEDVRRIPDLFFDVQQLVVADALVACRIRFVCTPSEPFRGREPTGLPIDFAEHVFYRFREDRIVQVWSLLDLEALERQLPQTTR